MDCYNKENRCEEVKEPPVLPFMLTCQGIVLIATLGPYSRYRHHRCLIVTATVINGPKVAIFLDE